MRLLHITKRLTSLLVRFTSTSFLTTSYKKNFHYQRDIEYRLTARGKDEVFKLFFNNLITSLLADLG